MKNDLLFYFIVTAIASVLLIIVIIDLFLIVNIKNKKSKILKLENEKKIKELLEQQGNIRSDAAIVALEKERMRIAKELHDKVGGILGVAKLNFSSLQADMEKLRKQSLEQYLQVEKSIEEAIMEVRKMSHDFKDASILQFNLVESIEQLKQTIETANIITVHFSEYQVANVPYLLGINIYRICRELVNNTLKHAQASKITIQINMEVDTKKLQFSYEDNGIGFDKKALENSKNTGMGIQNFEQTAKELGATCIIESAPGKGMYLLFEAVLPNDNITL